MKKVDKNKISIHNNMIKNNDFWFPLDNLAKIFPSNSSGRLTTLFRITVLLNSPVNVSILQKASDHLFVRFPYFKVELRKGFFWYYFQSNPNPLKMMADSKYPCMKMPFKKKGALLLRIKPFKNRISVEMSHILTDGIGALNLIKSLVAEYLKLTGIKINDWNGIIRVDDKINIEEWEDSFRNYYQKNIPVPKKVSNAFHFTFPFLPKGKYIVITGIMSANLLVKKAKEKNVSLNEFLIALYFDVIQDFYFSQTLKKRYKRPIRILVPVNLRQMYPSQSMRNFFLPVYPEIDPRLGKYSFDEILKIVYHYMKVEINEKSINQQIKRNVSGETNAFVRSVPLFIKNFGLYFIYNFFGDNQYTSSMSNLGRVSMPDCFKNIIKGFDFIPPPNPQYKISCTAISYLDRMSITFGKLVIETDIERLFFTKLVKMGIPVKIQTNQE